MTSRRAPALALGLALALAPLSLPAVARAEGTGPSKPEALHLEVGAVARHQIVAIGRDVLVQGEALEGVAALDGSVRVEGSVRGDVTVLGGDALLSSTAVVDGDVHVLGGSLRAERGARLGGRSVAYPTFSRAWLTLLEGPSLGLSSTSPLVVAAKLGLVAAWLALSLLLFATGGRALLATSEEVRLEPLRCFAAGLTGIASAALTALVFSALLPALVAVPILMLVALAALLAKLWGCLLYTSDAADEEDSVDLGLERGDAGRRRRRAAHQVRSARALVRRRHAGRDLRPALEPQTPRLTPPRGGP